ncbi:MAG: DUF1934 domain-containing protein [Lachnospiraceae bacterium]|nr:DUF1934 domain-containing protein [Lachnospiraceae bacterium]MCR4938231.1 DUF1934 domain-containing protein [Lachnospiraceae bacterium]
MTKDVLISLKGLQYRGPDGEQGDAEMIVPGSYYEKDGKKILIYDEPAGDGDGNTHTMVKIMPDSVEISRKGFTNSSMNFYKGQKNMCSYNMPFGSLMMGIDTEDIKIDTPDDDMMRIEIDYRMDINYSFYADCKMVMEVRSKAGAGVMFKNPISAV